MAQVRQCMRVVDVVSACAPCARGDASASADGGSRGVCAAPACPHLPC
jgi:hypothetical protein